MNMANDLGRKSTKQTNNKCSCYVLQRGFTAQSPMLLTPAHSSKNTRSTHSTLDTTSTQITLVNVYVDLVVFTRIAGTS